MNRNCFAADDADHQRSNADSIGGCPQEVSAFTAVLSVIRGNVVAVRQSPIELRTRDPHSPSGFQILNQGITAALTIDTVRVDGYFSE